MELRKGNKWVAKLGVPKISISKRIFSQFQSGCGSQGAFFRGQSRSSQPRSQPTTHAPSHCTQTRRFTVPKFHRRDQYDSRPFSTAAPHPANFCRETPSPKPPRPPQRRKCHPIRRRARSQRRTQHPDPPPRPKSRTMDPSADPPPPAAAPAPDDARPPPPPPSPREAETPIETDDSERSTTPALIEDEGSLGDSDSALGSDPAYVWPPVASWASSDRYMVHP
jgi:hypothetical protein